jgi:hypothetical protein
MKARRQPTKAGIKGIDMPCQDCEFVGGWGKPNLQRSLSPIPLLRDGNQRNRKESSVAIA